MRRHTQIALGCVALTTLFVGVVQAEPLTPPAGPVAGTGPTQIFALPFTISQPGSYVVVRDLTGVPGQNGITISSSGVTLDLNGFTLHGVPGSLNGIAFGGFQENVVIHNGHVRDWDGDGIRGFIDVGRIERISAADNGGWGINNAAGAFSSHIVSCEAFSNGSGGAGGGIRVGSNAVITGCVVRSNTGPGVSGVLGVTVEDTTSRNNSGVGFLLGNGAVVRGCTATSNFNPAAAQASRPDFDDRDAQRLLSTTSGPQAPPFQRPDFVDPFADYVDPVVIDERTGEVIPGLVSFGTEGVLAGGDGFRLGAGSLIEGCVAHNNGDDGIAVGLGSTVVNCSASDNGSNGIVTGASCTVSGNTARSNGGDGISTKSGCTVSGNTAGSNTGDGIQVTGDCLVLNNNCDSNGNIGDGAGIHVTFDNNRIDGNNVTDNDRGIDVDGVFPGNLIIRNSASGNTVNYSITGVQTMGPIITATGTITSTNPWANFSF